MLAIRLQPILEDKAAFCKRLCSYSQALHWCEAIAYLNWLCNLHGYLVDKKYQVSDKHESHTTLPTLEQNVLIAQFQLYQSLLVEAIAGFYQMYKV